jgi:general secretion pathway protein J
MKVARGFSLMEVLAALALLAILLLGVYSGVRSTTLSVSHGSSVIARLDEVRGAREFLRRQLSSATALPWKMRDENVPVVFEGDGTHLRFVSTLPGYLGKLGPQLVEITLADDGRDGRELEARLSPLPGRQSTVTTGAQDALLSHVRSIRLRYAARGTSTWQDRWNEPMTLPGAIEISVVPEEGSDAWPLLVVAPRQDPDAVNVRGAARSLPGVVP